MLNVPKCNAMSYTCNIQPLTIMYIIKGESQIRATFSKNQGIVFDAQLRFMEHINMFL